MTSTAKVTSSLQAVRTISSPSPRRARWAWLELVRESVGGALLLVAWLALWTVTWAAVAGPLAPVRDAQGVVATLGD